MIRSLDWLSNFFIALVGLQILIAVLNAVLITSIMISIR